MRGRFGMVGEDGELKMTLVEHLQELRGRLIQCIAAVLVLGAVSLCFAKPLFAVLMRPVLEALPLGERALIYTSGIEELNVLMKVGLYAGLFFSTPFILWQLWAFVSPGLYEHEKKLASPFIALGSLAFIAGTLFCYFGLLPTMFQFLLQDADTIAIRQRMSAGISAEEEALRFLRLGEVGRAAELSRNAQAELVRPGDGNLGSGIREIPEDKAELVQWLSAFGRLIDATGVGLGAPVHPALIRVMEKRIEAEKQVEQGNLRKATDSLAEAVALWTTVDPPHAEGLLELWKLSKQLAAGKVRLLAESWTRPMLTMREQLSLVLLLELAFGIIFELPLILALLGAIGLVKSSFLMKYQRHAFIVCLIVAAVITPTGDAINLALMAGPMVLCYEMGVVAVWLIERRAKRTTQSTPAVAA